MPGHKGPLHKVVAAFLADNPDDGGYLIDSLGERGEPDLELEALIRAAATRAALRDPSRPLDQRVARKAYLVLFRKLEAARLGKLTVGRRGHPTRFRFAARTRIQTPGASSAKEVGMATGRPAPTSAPGDAPRRDDVIARLKAKGHEIHKLGVTHLCLFGSVARDEARPDSDVDLLATFASTVTSDAFFGAKFFLEDLLGRRIDLVTESALRDRVRQNIEPDLIRVA